MGPLLAVVMTSKQSIVCTHLEAFFSSIHHSCNHSCIDFFFSSSPSFSTCETVGQATVVSALWSGTTLWRKKVGRFGAVKVVSGNRPVADRDPPKGGGP